MIVRTFTEGPWKGLAALDLALSPYEIDRLQEFAVEADDWQPGRQQGDTYFKLDLLDQAKAHKWSTGEFEEPALANIHWRLLYAISEHTRVPVSEFYEKSDFYLIYYPEGGSVGKHKDPAPAGKKHFRANVAVTEPAEGGVLVLPNGFYVDANLPIRLSPGHGLVFEPSEVEHGVTPVGKGGRLVVSVGAIL